MRKEKVSEGSPRALLADKAYDIDELIAHGENQFMEIVIPSKENRKDEEL